MTDSFNSNSPSDSHNVSDAPIFEAFKSQHPDVEESIEDQDALASLAYSVPPMPLNPQLKQRLFGSLGLQLEPDDLYALLNLSIEALKTKSTALSWEAIAEAPGFETAICQKNHANRMVACFIKADHPASFPNHSHPSEEVILILGGDLIEENQHYTVGDRIQSAAGSSHQLSTTQGCLLFCIASMDNQFIASEQ